MMTRRTLPILGLLTWLLVGVPSVALRMRGPAWLTPATAVWFALYFAFIVCFWLATRPGCGTMMKTSLIVAESVIALGAIAIQPDGFEGVLLVIIAAQLGAESLRRSIIWIIVLAVCHGLILLQTDRFWLAIAVSYLAFQFFGLFTSQIANSESKAREALAEANAQLMVTSGLLDISSRASERLRISRDLHDLLGHHLTALSLNLEVASHLAEGDARESIERSKEITKVLLSDVREVVTRLRDEEPVDLSGALRSLKEVITSPTLHLEFPGDAAIADGAIAQVALRALQEIVTNAVRHSGARNLWLRLASGRQSLEIDARDDGDGADPVQFGNGLRGIRERVEEVEGSLQISSVRGRGFSVHIHIPLEVSR